MAVDGSRSMNTFSGFLLAFDIVYLLGLVCLGAVLLTALCSPNVKRASTWLMVVFSWIATSLGNLILVGQQTGRPPMDVACLLQAMLIHALPIFTSFYVTAFMLQVTLLHLVPCGSFVCALLAVMILGITNPSLVQRDPLGMYCHLISFTVPRIIAAFTVSALAIFLSLEALIAVMLWRLWKSTGRLNPLRRSHEHISFDVALRVVIFGFCPMVAIGVASLQYFPKTKINTIASTLIQAVLPVVAGVIFGTQRDIVRVWIFWKKDPEQMNVKSDLA